MADIKIDKVEYNIFLNSVKNYIEKSNNTSEDLINEKEYILNYINREQELSILLEQKKLLYNFYIVNKHKDPAGCEKILNQYLEVKDKIIKMKEQNN